ncbi:hypothetical protein [Wenjunlia tyrosinilytica]|uniref:Uncharacterized protein n=1 Tax=Wenjunlia tyrosinilytica TaxID=1544741 RepID=A0A917ZBE2_9ACTN|nr:hypothetical protein [Wenjunlia tyrosinilytica]GGO80240.1 hypothetical protein GCM10012280_01640 [Wenjunlia tyrosinilytica]
MGNEGDGWVPGVWDPKANGGAGGWVRRQDTGTHHLGRPTAPEESAPEEPAPEQESRSEQESGPEDAQDDARSTSRANGQTSSIGPLPAGSADTRVGAPRDEHAARTAPQPPPFRPPAPTAPYPQPFNAPPPPPLPPRHTQFGKPPYTEPPHPGAQHAEPPFAEPQHPAPPYPQQFPPHAPGREPGYHGGAGPEPAHDGGAGRKWLIALALGAVGVGLGFGAVYALDSGGGGGDKAAHSPAPDPGKDKGGKSDGQAPDTSDSSASSPSASATPDDPAAEQAGDLDDLLGQSSQDRKKVSDAVNAVDACASSDTVSTARSDLRDAAEHRDQLVDKLDSLELDRVEGGAEAAAALRTAWQHSADADRAFADWATTMAAGGCSSGSAPHDADYDLGTASSERASKAKKDFVKKWNPIAGEHGLEARSADAL